MTQAFSLFTCVLLLLFSQTVNATQTEITFAYVGKIEHPAYLGISLGLNEANLQGQFLGQKYAIETFSSIADLPDKLDDFLAIIAAVPRDELMNLREIARQHPVFNLLVEDDDLRSACLDNVLSIIPGEKMKQDAIAQWTKKNPENNAVAQAWHDDFEKFAGRDLNKRFRKAFDKGMDDYAWAGWAAIRMTADSVARENITDPVTLLNHLKTNLSFDGQKGVDMNFRETGQLRQPLLIVENNSVVGEAPVRGVSNDIDSLGISKCAK